VAVVIDLVPRALGADPVQWRALLRASLLSDVRSLRGAGLQMGRSGVQSVWGLVVAQLLYGGVCAMLITALPDVFFTTTVYYMLLGSTLGLAVLADFSGIVLSPDDYGILAHRPVDGRTFFAARLSSVVVYMWLLTLPFAALPTIGYLVKDSGGSLAGALASLAGAFTAATLVPLAAIVCYVSLMQLIPPQRLHRWLGYVQFLLSFLFIGTVLLYSRSLRALGELSLDKTPVVYLNPATWLAAWVEIAEQRAVPADLAVAGLPLLAIGVLVVAARHRLSMHYAEKLAVLSARHDGSGVAHLPVRAMIAGPAHHAVALLAKAQFRSDQKFRLGVMGILPLTVIYLMMGFTEPDGPVMLRGEPVLVYYAVLLFPAMLRQFFVHSEAWRASWVFHTAPMPFEDIVVGLKNTLVARFLVPYLAFVLVLLYVFAPRPWLELLMHGLVLGLLSHGLLAADLLINPSLPFSQPARQGARSFALLVVMLPAMLIVSTLPLWRPYIYASTVRTFTALGVLVVINVLLHESLLTRVARLGRQWRYAG
jgi:hypothetical protein